MTDLILTNGRSPQNKKGDYITVARAEELIAAELAECDKLVQWYMNQIPGLMKKMIEEAVRAALLGYHHSLQERGIVPPDEPIPEN